jgi:hypothetical protein
MTRRRVAAALALLCAAAWVVPHRLCAREVDDWWRGEPATQLRLERGLAEIVTRPLSRRDFPTGSKVLDGEWLFGTYMMAAMGFGQLALEHPELRDRELPKMRACIDRMIARDVRAFDMEAWDGDDPIDGLDGDRHHGSYLGYLDLALSLERLLDPSGPHAQLNDRVTTALARRLERSPSLLLDSYPGQVFPVDNAAVIGAIALYDRATRADHRALVELFTRRLRERSRDPRSGLLRQTMPHGAPRGSGTALAAYFLSFADPSLAAELVASMKRELQGDVLGFGALREYPRGRSGRGDADSGPLVAGFGVSASGFAVGAARAVGDRALFEQLYPTVILFGGPSGGESLHFATGGPVGNAILFAMLTARRSVP